MKLSVDQVNYLNIGLMLVSCILAFGFPFELFLFSYAALGPLHYFTEISWLQERNYFTHGKQKRKPQPHRGWLVLVALTTVAVIAGFMLTTTIWEWPPCISSAFFMSCSSFHSITALSPG